MKRSRRAGRRVPASIDSIVSGVATVDAVRTYWERHIHDLEITAHPIGSRGFFEDLDHYHFEKLHHLLALVDFDGYRDRRVLDVGCGAGVDTVRFARGGARVTGVDLASSAVALSRANFAQQQLPGQFLVGDGERLPLASGSFDYVFAHGVVQYTPDPAQLIRECHRVLRPGGQAVFQVYNRISWLNLMSKVSRVQLEHEDAPVLRRFSIGEFRALLAPFPTVRMVPERFPVRSRLHKGWKGALFNGLFVGTFNSLPRSWVRRFGWHLLAFCTKGS